MGGEGMGRWAGGARGGTTETTRGECHDGHLCTTTQGHSQCAERLLCALCAPQLLTPLPLLPAAGLHAQIAALSQEVTQAQVHQTAAVGEGGGGAIGGGAAGGAAEKRGSHQQHSRQQRSRRA